MKKDLISIKVFEQLNKALLEKSRNSNIIGHNLEKGLGNENIIRDLLIDFLPEKYGVAKGKIINSRGHLSKHCDIIIYDKLNCPKLFIDENKNQILPIEGVYSVIEVKSTLDSNKLKESFENLNSVFLLNKRNQNQSINEKVDIYPPNLSIIAFADKRTLASIEKQYVLLNEAYKVNNSFESYSPLSPGFKDHNGKKHLVSSINILNKGSVYHMYKGTSKFSAHEEFTLGIFLTGFVSSLEWIKLEETNLLNYLNWINVAEIKNTKNTSK